MSAPKSVPSDVEYDALAALGETHMDFFVARAVPMGSEGNVFHLMLFTKSLLAMWNQHVVIEDPLVESFLVPFDENDVAHKVYFVVCKYLSPADQQLFGGEVSVVAARRSTSMVAATTLERYLSEVF